MKRKKPQKKQSKLTSQALEARCLLIETRRFRSAMCSFSNIKNREIAKLGGFGLSSPHLLKLNAALLLPPTDAVGDPLPPLLPWFAGGDWVCWGGCDG